MRKAGYDYGKGDVSRLARDSRVSRSTLYQILYGGIASPGVSVMVQLADTLGVDVHDLLVEKE
jgi:transcriptional regulator with XRE-family HTH domain